MRGSAPLVEYEGICRQASAYEMVPGVVCQEEMPCVLLKLRVARRSKCRRILTVVVVVLTVAEGPSPKCPYERRRLLMWIGKFISYRKDVA